MLADILELQRLILTHRHKEFSDGWYNRSIRRGGEYYFEKKDYTVFNSSSDESTSVTSNSHGHLMNMIQTFKLEKYCTVYAKDSIFTIQTCSKTLKPVLHYKSCISEYFKSTVNYFHEENPTECTYENVDWDVIFSLGTVYDASVLIFLYGLFLETECSTVIFLERFPYEKVLELILYYKAIL